MCAILIILHGTILGSRHVACHLDLRIPLAEITDGAGVAEGEVGAVEDGLTPGLTLDRSQGGPAGNGVANIVANIDQVTRWQTGVWILGCVKTQPNFCK